jgi:hypothetical protein
LFKKNRNKNGNGNWRIKRKKEKLSSPLGRIRPTPGRLPSSSRPCFPLSAHCRPAPACAAALRSPPSLSLTSQPHLPATPSRALPLAGKPAPPVSRFVVLPAYDAPPSPRPSPRRTGEFGTAPSSPLDRVHAQYRPRREVSSSPLCGINAGAVHLTGARRAPPLPFPRAPIKRSPRAPPSPHRPQPPPSSPRPSSIREAPPSSPSPVSLPPLLPPSLLVQRAIKLAYQLHHFAVNSEHHSPAPIPRPKLTDGDPRRGAPPPPRGQPPPGPL